MFPFPIAKPQGCDIQIFNGSRYLVGTNQNTWNKPIGVSHVYMLLIGPGGDGDAAVGGGSGAVTVWYGAAQHVPNSLVIAVATNQSNATTVFYRNTNPTPLTLLTANPGQSGVGGTVMTANQFTASGFFKSTAGQNGSSTNTTASSTTFLSGGAGTNNSATANYGYTNSNSGGLGRAGYFQMQPIIVGTGGSDVYPGGIGCGGGITGVGGSGMVLIASW